MKSFRRKLLDVCVLGWIIAQLSIAKLTYFCIARNNHETCRNHVGSVLIWWITHGTYQMCFLSMTSSHHSSVFEFNDHEDTSRALPSKTKKTVWWKLMELWIYILLRNNLVSFLHRFWSLMAEAIYSVVLPLLWPSKCCWVSSWFLRC